MTKTFAPLAAALCASLLLAGCGGDPAPTPQPGPVQPGPAQPEQPQLGSVLGTIRPLNPAYTQVKTEELAGSSGVDNAGKFGFALPTPEQMQTTYRADLFPVYDAEQELGVFGLCGRDVTKTNAPGDLRLYPLNKLVTNTGAQLFANRDASGSTALPLKIKVWWYASKAATFNFKGECILWGKVDTTLSLRAGWNVLDVDLYGDRATLNVATQPDASLTWTPYSGDLSGLSADRVQIGGQSVSLALLLEPWKAARTNLR